MKLTGAALLKRFSRAKSARSNWEDLWQDIYDFMLPAREGFYETVPGEERTVEIYDETALVSLSDFVSRIKQGIVPSHSIWWLFEPGPEISRKAIRQLQAELTEVTKFVWDALANSNFDNEAQEVITDLGVGWSTMIVEDGIDGKLLNFKTVPQSHTFWDTGPFKTVDGVFRIREAVRIADIQTIWPDATISEQLKGKLNGNPDAETNLIEASYRDWDELNTQRYIYQVVASEDKSLVLDSETNGLGARPYVTPRWSVAAGEVYGRGPLINALPAIRTTNLVTEMILENSQMAISGLWQIDDDGEINVDNVEIVPGAVYARPPDSRGLERTDSPSNFNVADIVLTQQQTNIRKALFAQDLGPLDQTPRSATEINARMADLAEQTSGPAARLKTEWTDQLLQRVIFLLTEQGVIEMPRLDGRQIRIIAKSPLARAQKFDEIERLRGFAGDVLGILGPQAGQVFLEQGAIVDQLQEKWEVPATLVRDEDAREELVANVGEIGAEAPAPGGLPAQTAIGQ